MRSISRREKARSAGYGPFSVFSSRANQTSTWRILLWIISLHGISLVYITYACLQNKFQKRLYLSEKPEYFRLSTWQQKILRFFLLHSTMDAYRHVAKEF